MFHYSPLINDKKIEKNTLTNLCPIELNNQLSTYNQMIRQFLSTTNFKSEEWSMSTCAFTGVTCISLLLGGSYLLCKRFKSNKWLAPEQEVLEQEVLEQEEEQEEEEQEESGAIAKQEEEQEEKNEAIAKQEEQPKSQLNIDSNGTSFPELKGMTVESAIEYMKTNHPHLNCYPVASDCIRILDLRNDRVWLNLDSENKILDVPVIG